MRPFIGFVLLTHDKPQQMLRLVNTLNALFNHPPIVIHHDQDRCPLSVQTFPSNIRWVTPHIPTAWAGPSLNGAAIAAINLLFSSTDAPEWFTLLSGADYPLKSADQIKADLVQSGVDAFVDARWVTAGATDSWGSVMADRYLQGIIRIPYLDRSFSLKHRSTGIPHRIANAFGMLPFKRGYACYSGSQWFTANRKAAQVLIDEHEKNDALRHHYWRVSCADESYFQTILGNCSEIRIDRNNRRYFEFTPGDAHPKMLGLSDLPQLLSSTAHFARKFTPDNPVLDELDKAIGIRPRAASAGSDLS